MAKKILRDINWRNLFQSIFQKVNHNEEKLVREEFEGKDRRMGEGIEK